MNPLTIETAGLSPGLARLARLARLRSMPSGVAAVSADLRLFLGPDFWALSDAERLGVVAHEMAHILCRHHARGEAMARDRWNRACDARINGALRREGFAIPESGIFPETLGLGAGWTALTEEDIYKGIEDAPAASSFFDVLTDAEAEEMDGEEGEGQERDGGQGEAMARAAAALLRRQAIDAAIAAALGAGELPGSLAEVAPYLPPMVAAPRPQWARLARALRGARPRRTYSAYRLSPSSAMLKGSQPSGPASLLVLVDVSGSMSSADIQRGIALVAACRVRASIRILTHDTERRGAFSVVGGRWPLIVSSGGGTALASSLDGESADALIVVSDLQSADGLPSTERFGYVGVIGADSYATPNGWEEIRG